MIYHYTCLLMNFANHRLHWTNKSRGIKRVRSGQVENEKVKVEPWWFWPWYLGLNVLPWKSIRPYLRHTFLMSQVNNDKISLTVLTYLIFFPNSFPPSYLFYFTLLRSVCVSGCLSFFPSSLSFPLFPIRPYGIDGSLSHVLFITPSFRQMV